MRGKQKFFCVLMLVLFVSCKGEKEEGLAEVDAKYKTLIENFANYIVHKNYRSAYDLTSPNLRNRLTYQEFVESWTSYRDGFPNPPKVEFRRGDDPQEMAEFVPEADRASLVEEITLVFSGVIEGEEAQFYCTTWIVDDGTPYISSFYIED